MDGRLPAQQPRFSDGADVEHMDLPSPPAPLSPVTVDVAIPVFNEERALPGCIETLHDFLTERLPFEWVITIVDNASTDGTLLVAKRLAKEWSRVRVSHLERQGKGHAVRAAWENSDASVVAYMDVDLSTGLDALLPMVTSLAEGHSDIAIGSRLAPGARTVRGAKRELMSLGYNTLLRVTHGAQFRDAQCGFKAARADVIRPLLQRVEDDTWFFDTELLLLAEHNEMRVLEVPVDWVEDVDSRVNVGNTISTNLRGLVRVGLAKLSGAADITELPPQNELKPTHPDAMLPEQDVSRLRHLLLFCVVGFVATLMTLTLYTFFRSWWPPLAANLVAVTLSTLFNTEANRRFTFRDRTRSPALVHVQSFIVFALYCGFTSGALLLLQLVAHQPPRWVELVVLIVASGFGTLGRFALLTTWVFRVRPNPHPVVQTEESPT